MMLVVQPYVKINFRLPGSFLPPTKLKPKHTQSLHSLPIDEKVEAEKYKNGYTSNFRD